MYAVGNPKTKKELRARIASGEHVRAFQPGPFDGTSNGTDVIEGPHYPKPHRWYARVEICDGIIVKVLS